ncbi:hypothetical protein HNR54_001000 [Methanothermobacter sp. DSM 3267]
MRFFNFVKFLVDLLQDIYDSIFLCSEVNVYIVRDVV